MFPKYSRHLFQLQSSQICTISSFFSFFSLGGGGRERERVVSHWIWIICYQNIQIVSVIKIEGFQDKIIGLKHYQENNCLVIFYLYFKTLSFFYFYPNPKTRHIMDWLRFQRILQQITKNRTCKPAYSIGYLTVLFFYTKVYNYWTSSYFYFTNSKS